MDTIINGALFSQFENKQQVLTPWVGFDLDGTLAVHGEWRGPRYIGDPIMPMVERAKAYIANGTDIRIVTARVGGSMSDHDRSEVMFAIDNWCKQHLGRTVRITASKDYQMLYLYDDRCRQVIPNTGIVVGE